MKFLLSLLLFPVLLFGQFVEDNTCSASDPCYVVHNVADRMWYYSAADHSPGAERDPRPGEIGYRVDEALHELEFMDVPIGKTVVIQNVYVDTYANFTREEKGWSYNKNFGVALSALHSRNGLDAYTTNPPSSRDALIWLQSPIDSGPRWIQAPGQNSVLPHNKLWIKHAMFNNVTGNKVLMETTAHIWYYFTE